MNNNQKRKNITQPVNKNKVSEERNPYEEDGKEYMFNPDPKFGKKVIENKDFNTRYGSKVIKRDIEK